MYLCNLVTRYTRKALYYAAVIFFTSLHVKTKLAERPPDSHVVTYNGVQKFTQTFDWSLPWILHGTKSPWFWFWNFRPLAFVLLSFWITAIYL